MDDATLDLVLQGAGITPSHPQYAVLKAALRRQAAALSSTQGEDTRRWDLDFGQTGARYAADARYQQGQLQNAQYDAETRRRALENDARRIDLESRDIQNRYDIALRSARTDEERMLLDRWKAERDNEIQQRKNQLDEMRIGIEQGRLGLDTELGRGRLGLEAELGRGRLGLDTELGRGDLALKQGSQALDVLKTGVDLGRQPRNWAAALDWRRGVAANPMAVGSLRALLGNSAATGNVPTMVTPQGLPQQNGLAATLAGYGVGTAASDATNAAQAGAAAGSGGGATPKADVDPRVAGIQAIMKNYSPSDGDGYDAKDIASLRAITALAAQGTQKTANRVAQMDEDEQQFLAGGLDTVIPGSGDWWLRQSERQRVGQRASGRAA